MIAVAAPRLAGMELSTTQLLSPVSGAVWASDDGSSSIVSVIDEATASEVNGPKRARSEGTPSRGCVDDVITSPWRATAITCSAGRRHGLHAVVSNVQSSLARMSWHHCLRVTTCEFLFVVAEGAGVPALQRDSSGYYAKYQMAQVHLATSRPRPRMSISDAHCCRVSCSDHHACR